MPARKLPDFQQFSSVITTVVLVGGTIAAANIFGSKLTTPCRLDAGGDAKEWILIGGTVGALLVGAAHIWVAFRHQMAWFMIVLMAIGYSAIVYGSVTAPRQICTCGIPVGSNWDAPWFGGMHKGAEEVLIWILSPLVNLSPSDSYGASDFCVPPPPKR